MALTTLRECDTRWSYLIDCNICGELATVLYYDDNLNFVFDDGGLSEGYLTFATTATGRRTSAICATTKALCFTTTTRQGLTGIDQR